ncbi:MAG: ABC transporter permease [Hydrotalea sp.]|nr:ABC transporter permease [Hydrotalea sp.]
MNKTWIIAQREFLSRVQKKTFLLSTIGLPLLIFGFYALIGYFAASSDSEGVTIGVADKNQLLGEELQKDNDSKDIKFIFQPNASEKELIVQVEEKKIDGYIFIPETMDINNHQGLRVNMGKGVGLLTSSKVQNSVESILEQKKLLSLNISKAQLDSAKKSASIEITSLDGKDNKNITSGIAYGIGFVSGFLIYIILFIYGSMVMRGVMEEKTNRIAEVIVSSVKPFQLMMGKIIGIGAVGLVQFLIWVLLVTMVQATLPAMFPEIGGSMQAMEAGDVPPPDMNSMQQVFSQLSNFNFPLIIGCFIFYFLGGYLLYSALFAAVGSAVNEDPQDAQSLMLPITLPIVFGIVIMMRAVNEPNSSLAVFGSLFPLTSPIVMMSRIPYGLDVVPLWQLIVSMLLLILTFILFTWFAGKIYRTAILMYGKKITWKELLKWGLKKA